MMMSAMMMLEPARISLACCGLGDLGLSGSESRQRAAGQVAGGLAIFDCGLGRHEGNSGLSALQPIRAGLACKSDDVMYVGAVGGTSLDLLHPSVGREPMRDLDVLIFDRSPGRDLGHSDAISSSRPQIHVQGRGLLRSRKR